MSFVKGRVISWRCSLAKYEVIDIEAHVERVEKRKTYNWTGTTQPDPHGLAGVQVVLMRQHEYRGTILASCTDSQGEVRCFTRLETGSMAWFPLEDLEPSDEPTWADLTEVEKLQVLFAKEDREACSSESGQTGDQHGQGSPVLAAVSADS